jgi:hypothetical protein
VKNNLTLLTQARDTCGYSLLRGGGVGLAKSESAVGGR